MVSFWFIRSGWFRSDAFVLSCHSDVCVLICSDLLVLIVSFWFIRSEWFVKFFRTDVSF